MEVHFQHTHIKCTLQRDQKASHPIQAIETHAFICLIGLSRGGIDEARKWPKVVPMPKRIANHVSKPPKNETEKAIMKNTNKVTAMPIKVASSKPLERPAALVALLSAPVDAALETMRRPT